MKAEELFSVAGKSVVVTGGANGLGFAMTRALSDNGARVIIMDIDAEASAAAVAELLARGPIQSSRRQKWFQCSTLSFISGIPISQDEVQLAHDCDG